jgi:hypothetical protein
MTLKNRIENEPEIGQFPRKNRPFCGAISRVSLLPASNNRIRLVKNTFSPFHQNASLTQPDSSSGSFQLSDFSFRIE